MTEREYEDLIRETTRQALVDKRFTIRGPVRHLRDGDIINAFLDYSRRRGPHLTYCMEFHKSQMRVLSEEQLVRYIEMKVRFAEDGLRDELEEPNV